MSRRLRMIAVLGAGLLVLTATACRNGDTLEFEPPASKVAIDGTDRYRLVLTPNAVERLDIQTVPVEENGDQLSVTRDALILDTTGVFWVYINPEPNTYERVEVSPVREVDGVALFSSGPALGTSVVFVGAAELYGEETGVGK